MRIILVLLLLSPFLRAQTTFHRIYTPIQGAGSYAMLFDIANSPGGGYLTTGASSDTITASFLTRMNNNGDVIWTRRLLTNTIIYSLERSSANGYYFASYMSPPNRTVFFATDSMLNVNWSIGYAVPNSAVFTRSFKQTNDGSYIFGGIFATPSKPYGFIGKISPNGVPAWSKTFTVPNKYAIEIKDFIDDGNGYYIGTGQCTYNDDIFFIRSDTAGNIQWAGSYDLDSTYEWGSDIDITSDGGYVITGYYRKTQNSPAKILLLKFGSDDSLQWAKAYSRQLPGLYLGEAPQCTVIPNGQGFAITGVLQVSAGEFPYLMFVDTAGTFLTGNYYSLCRVGNISNMNIRPRITNDGGYILCSFALANTSANFGQAGQIIKTDNLGATGCFETPFQLTDSAITLNLVPGVVDSLGINPLAIPLVFDTINVYYSSDCEINVGMDERGEDKRIYLYPNPSSGTFIITSEEAIRSIEVFDMLGNKIFTGVSDSKEITLELPNSSSGVYFVVVHTLSFSRAMKLIIHCSSVSR
ncbi:MAG: T9SS type A sorting domain-containing protein [Bacteroidota bacterium]